jgi:hypothetical protein
MLVAAMQNATDACDFISGYAKYGVHIPLNLR